MKVIAIGLAAFVFISALITGLFAHKSSNAAVEGFKFSYYPEVNVYYDHSHNNLLYTLDGGKSWTSMPRHKDSLPATLGKPVTFQSTVATAWTQNAIHRAKYSGVTSDFTLASLPFKDDNAKLDGENKGEGKEARNEKMKKKDHQETKKSKGKWLKDLKEKIKKVGARFKKED